MKNLLALVGLVVVLVAGAGWYLGWYKLSSESGHVKVDLDTKEMTDDLKKGRDAFNNILENQGKKVEGQPTSLPFDGKGNFSIPPLPKLPEVPSAVAPLEFNKDGSLKTTIKIDLPPPPAFPGNK
jgi:hypothetical protein